MLRLFMQKTTERYQKLGYHAGQRAVHLVSTDGTELWLYFDERSLLELLTVAGEDGPDVWGEPLSDEESAARFLTIHLDESLDTSELPLPQRWRYRACAFHPVLEGDWPW